MIKEIKHPEKEAATGAYSAAIAAGGWLFVSGQGPLDLRTGAIVVGTIEEETRLTLQHIGKILAAAGCSFADVVRCGCHLADINDFDRFNATYAEFFPGMKPARTTVQSGLGGIKVEIDCIAQIPPRQAGAQPKRKSTARREGAAKPRGARKDPARRRSS
jgi:2-iminobutanoate/2-iminopropanoate deaminase